MARMKLTEAPKLPVAWRRAPENLKRLEVEAKFLDARFREEFGVRLGVIFIDTLAAAYDADWFRAGLAKRRITPCIPSKANRKTTIPYDALLYKQSHKIENMFGRLKDWRRIAHPIRPLRPHLLLGNLHRRSRHILAVINELVTLGV